MSYDISPHDYALRMGWDFTCIEATAAEGVSDTDCDIIRASGGDDSDIAALLAWCRAAVEAVER